MKKMMVVSVALVTAMSVLAAPKAKRSVAVDEETTTGKAAKILIEQEPKLGQQSCLAAPSVSGASLVG